MTKAQKILLVAIMLLAIFFRYYKITEMPGGLFPDEAANGLDINLMQQGHLQPFYERGNGREALFFYMEWASVSVFGVGAWQFHVVSALGGVLAVLFCFLAAKRLFEMDLAGIDPADENYRKLKNRAAYIALLAAFLMAVSSWHTVLSRTAFRATLIPMFTAMTFYFMLCAYQSVTPKKRLLFSVLTGASFALGFYTYIAYRIMAPILFMVLAWPLLAAIKEREFKATIKKYFLPAIGFAAAFIVVIFPIAKYFYDHPGSFVGRAGQVSIFNQTLYTVNGAQLASTPPLKTIASVAGEVFKTQFLAFFTHGDLNWRQNISGYPFLSPLVSPFFALALVIAISFAIAYFFMPVRFKRYWKFFLLVGWLFGMMLPVVTTAEGIPHGLRGIGVIPAVFILSACSIYEVWQYALKLHRKIYQKYYGPASWQCRLTTGALKLVIVAFVLALTLQTYFLYFVYAYNDPANFYYFRSDLTPVSQYLNSYGNKLNTYLVLDKYSVQTIDYLTTVDGAHPGNLKNMPYSQIDPENSWQLQLKPGDQAVFAQSSIFDITKFKQYHPDARLFLETRNKFGQAVLAVYKVY